MQFFPADYLRDTEILSLSAQGGWMRMLCSMWHPSRRGVLSLRLQAMARLLHASEQTTKSIIDEIGDCGVAVVEWGESGMVTITCRRIVRDWQTLADERAEISAKRSASAKAMWEKRKASAEQEQSKCNASAEQMQCIPDTRSQSSKRERAGASAPAPADDLAEQAKTIVEAYPRREKTAEALSVVLGALRTGESYAAMLAGTRACAAVIRTMPSAHLNRYVPGALAFFVSRRWADDPETLRRQGNQATGQGIRSAEEVKQMLGNRANEGDEGTF